VYKVSPKIQELTTPRDRGRSSEKTEDSGEIWEKCEPAPGAMRTAAASKEGGDYMEQENTGERDNL